MIFVNLGIFQEEFYISKINTFNKHYKKKDKN